MTNPSLPSASGAITFDASCNAEGTEFATHYTIEKTDFGVVVTGGDRISSDWQRCDVGDVGLGASANADQDCSSWHGEEFWDLATLDDVRRCISEGTEVNPTGSGSSALIHAAEVGAYEAMVALLNAGADPNITHSELDISPLHVAVELEQQRAVTALLEHGADPNIESVFGSPLHLASNDGPVGIIFALLSASADPTLENEFGETPVDLALRNHRLSGSRSLNIMTQSIKKPIPSGCNGWDNFGIWRDPTVLQVQRCLDAGADPNGLVPRAQGTVLGHVVANSNLISESSEVALALIKAGADPNAVFEHKPILHYAFNRAVSLEVFSALLDVGANSNSQDHEGRTPLLKALVNPPHLVKVQTLLDAGADPNIPNHRGTFPLHAALARNIQDETQFGLVQILLNTKSNIDVQDEEGRTPLHLAARWGTAEIVQLLLDAGARDDIKTSDGAYPKDFSDENRDEYVRAIFALLPTYEPIFETLSVTRNGGFVLYSGELCNRNEHIASEDIAGTRIFGVKISNSICTNLKILHERDYECIAHGGTNLIEQGVTNFRCDKGNAKINLYVKITLGNRFRLQALRKQNILDI